MATGFSGSVVVSLSNPGGGTLGGSLTLTAVGGYAYFTGLTIDTAGSDYTLQVSGGGLQSPNVPVPVSPGAATQLVFTNPPPSGVTAGSGFQVTVAAEDKFDNPTAFSGYMTVSLADNTGGITLRGTTNATAVGGSAAFTGLTIDTAGSGYTLQVKAGSLIPATDLIVVSPATATQLVVTTQPPSKVGPASDSAW